MIGAIILAAGLSRRMKRFKLLLPWGDATVIERVVRTVGDALPGEIVVVTGHRAEDVAAALRGTRARMAYNPDYAAGEMLSSVQVGLLALAADATGALVCLGDQPQMEVETVRAVLDAGEAAGWRRIIIPSYEMRAGHPILLPRCAWPAVIEATTTLKDALGPYRAEFSYVTVQTSSILADLDTPEDYERTTLPGVEPSGGSVVVDKPAKASTPGNSEAQ
jgi:molybdenum cofactor cytidylyltransferase